MMINLYSNMFRLYTKYLEKIAMLLILFQIMYVTYLFQIKITAAFVFILIFFVIDAMYWIVLGKPNIYKNIAFASLILIIVGTGGTYSLIYNIRHASNVPSDAKIGFISDWIGYAGSILGGSMTMFALIFTIQNEDKKRKDLQSQNSISLLEDKASNYLPIIELQGADTGINSLEMSISFITDKPIRFFGLIKQSFGNNSNIEDLFLLEDFPFLYSKEKVTIVLPIDTSKITHEFDTEVYLTKLYFSYNDVLNIKRYEHKIEFPLKIAYSKSNKKYYISANDSIKNYPVIESHFFKENEYQTKGNE